MKCYKTFIWKAVNAYSKILSYFHRSFDQNNKCLLSNFILIFLLYLTLEMIDMSASKRLLFPTELFII